MKKILQFASVFLLLTAFSSCKKVSYVTVGKPVYKSLTEIRNEISVSGAEPTNSDGKIYAAGKYLYYIAQESGVHVFDNSNPANPVNTAFIQLKGVHDIAIKGNYLFADNYVDFVVFDIADIQAIKLMKIVENVNNFYPELPEDIDYVDYSESWSADKVIVGYTKTIEKRKEKRTPPRFLEDVMTAQASSNSSSSGQVGIGGSYARFQINKNALYTVESFTMKVFDISNPVQTHYLKDVNMMTWLGGRFETLFKQGNNLFIGSTDGMYILDASDEFNPQYISGFSHATSCDPVVVDDNTAYITLRSGTNCNATIDDQVNVLDITTIEQHVLLSTYFMEQPLGVGIRNSVLYVCSGNGGLKVFDASNSNQLKLKNTYSGNLTDVIPLNTHLIAVGKNKIVQYSYGDNFTLEPISTVNF